MNSIPTRILSGIGTLIVVLCLLGTGHPVWAQCQDLGGYPWKTGGCLLSDDLNNAIAGRNPLLNVPPKANLFVNGFDNGAPLTAQVSFNNLSGTLVPTQIPRPTTSSLGGVLSYIAPGGQFLYGINTAGQPVSRNPTFSDLSGSLGPGQIPEPTTTTLGGVKSFVPQAGKVIVGLDDSGNLLASTMSGVSGASNIIATNGDLAAADVNNYPGGAWRNDYAAGRNAGMLFFKPQSGTCISHAMANDGGRCVDAVGGSFTSLPDAAGIGLRQFGADPAGALDSAVNINAAMNAFGDSSVPIIVDGKFLVNTALASDKRVTLLGRGGRDGSPTGTMTVCPAVSTFITNSNIDLLHLTGPTYTVTDICFQMAATANTRTSGSAFWAGRASSRQDGGQFRRNVIINPYDGVVIGDASGAPGTGTFLTDVVDNWIMNPSHIGIQNGRDSYALTTNASNFVNNRIGCNATHTTGVGIAIYDGAPTVDFGANPPYYCDVGSKIIPGTIGGTHGQGALVFWRGGIADSSRSNGLIIDATTPEARVFYTQFGSEPWVGSAEGSETPVKIRNTGNALSAIHDIQFIGGIFHGAASSTNSIFDLSGRLCRITIDGSSITGDGGPAFTTVGLTANNVNCATENTFNITGAHIGAGGSNLAVGVSITGTTDNFMITGSSFSPQTATPISWTPSPTSVAVVTNNLGTNFEYGPGLPAVGYAATNAALVALNTANYPNGIVRLDYAAGRGAGPLSFTPLTGTCAVNNLVNDGGRCVDTTGGNSWKAVHPAAGSSPKQWGCVGDGVADDTVCMQAAFTAAGNRKVTLQIGRLEMYGISSSISCGLPIKVVGDTASYGVTNTNLTGFKALVPNLTLLSLLNGCGGSIFEDLFFDMASAGANTSGAAISMGTGMMANIAGRIHLDRITVKGPCIGIEANGNNIHIDRSYIYDVAGVGCGGIRVGHYTKALTVGIRITRNTMVSKRTAAGVIPADFGMRFEDSGGAYVEENDILFFTKGTVMMPGDGQGVMWSFFNNTVLGDTTVEEGLFMDTAASTVINFRGHVFNNVWAAAYDNTTGKPNVTMQNTGGAALANIGSATFSNSRFYTTSGNGMDILAGQFISVDNNQICGYGYQGTPSAGVNVAAGLSNISIVNNRITPDCIGGNGNESAAIAMGGNHALGIIITGNTFKLDAGHQAISFVPTTGLERIIIANNYPLEASCGTIVSAASVVLTMAECDYVTGNAVITHIDNSGWSNRKKRLFLQGGASFGAGGAAGSGASGPMLTDFPSQPFGSVVNLSWNPASKAWSISEAATSGPNVATNADLATTKITDFPLGVTRLDYAAGRNAGPLFFVPQGATCTAVGLNNDGGRCVDTINGSSWKAIYPASGVSPKQWGCVGDGVADDTACMQAALDGVGNRKSTLLIGRREIYGISATLNCNLPMKVIGDSNGSPTGISTNSTGFKALAPNLNPMLSMGNPCVGSIFRDLFIDMGATASNTSGAAIMMGTSMQTSIPGRIEITRVSINAPCIGIDANGSQITLDEIIMTNVGGVGCGGIRVGHYTQNLTSDVKISRSNLISVPTGGGTPGDFGMRFEDVNSLVVSQNFVQFFTKGTVLLPGATQSVVSGMFNNTILGTATVEEPLFIDTAASATANRGHVFNNVSADANTSTAGKPAVTIQNTGALGNAVFGTFNFSNNRIGGISGNGFDILAGKFITLIGNMICRYGDQGTARIGVHVAANLTDISILNNIISPDCLNGLGTEASAIALDGGNNEIVITGNTMKLTANPPVVFVPVTGTERLVIANNYPLSAACGTVAAAATISLTMFDCDFITGAAVITSITNSGWVGRKKQLFLQAGASFATGGTAGSGSSGPINTALTAKGNGYVADAIWNASGFTWTVK